MKRAVRLQHWQASHPRSGPATAAEGPPPKLRLLESHCQPEE